MLENIKDFNLGGIKLNFNPEKRELSQTVWLDVGQPEWLKFDKSEVEFEPKIELIKTGTKISESIPELKNTLTTTVEKPQ